MDQTISDLERQNKNLQGMVSHYKQIIYDTVSISLNLAILYYKKITSLSKYFF